MTLLTMLLLGCRKDEPVEATGASSPLVPPVLSVTIDGPEGEAFVEYGLDGFDLATPASPTAAHHELAVLGLKAGHSYQWRAVVVDADGERHESEPGTFDVPEAPAKLLGGQVLVSEPESQLVYFFGVVILPDDTSYAAILDRDGDWVWWVDSGGELMVTPELGLDGRSVVWNQYDFGKYDDVGRLVRVSMDGKTRTETRLKMGHHDFVQHDDGTIAFLSMEFADIVVGPDTYRMGTDVILAGPEGMTDADTPAPVFSMLDDFPIEPAVTCDHIASRGVELGEEDVSEWTHGNSFMYLPETDRYYVNDKFTDWLFAVDRASGALDWIMNGREGDFTQPNGDPVWADIDQTTLWSHGHMSEIWDGGGMMYDNGDHHVPKVSRAIEFAWDEATMTAEVVWEFAEPSGQAEAALGDVRRLPGDNVLVTWSGNIGRITEVTRDHRVVWEATTPPGAQVGRLVPFTYPYTLK